MQQKTESPKIIVAIRKRPINKKELQKNETDIIRIEEKGSVVISEYKQKVDLTKYIEETTFNFDYAFNQKSDNEEIYSACIQPLIDSAFQGAKVSCFAYGQTGSGKTFTMKGDMEKGVPGLYYLGARQIFQYLHHPNFQHLQVKVSFFQIYCGKLYDLLNSRNQLKIREDKKNNINIIGIEEKPIQSAQQFLDIIEYGSNFRVTSQNATNADSSRSHAILQIILKEGKKEFTKISFIDLAGNQRGADHMDQNKQTKIDGAQINKSLLALKQCIRALDQNKGHTPFRGSKLTMVLKDSFVGFCKTVMIGNVSPNVSSAENTMNTLRYADRVKQLKNQNDAPLSREEQVAKQMMLPRNNKNSLKVAIHQNDDAEDIQMKKQLARKMLKKNSQKADWNNEMDIEVPTTVNRRRTDVYQHQGQQVKSEQRRSLAPKFGVEGHDENFPKQKHVNLPVRSQKQISKTRPLHFQNGDHAMGALRNNNLGFPRNQLSGHHNTQKMQLEYHHMLQDIEKMKEEFHCSHRQLICEEGYLVREEGELHTRFTRSSQVDLGFIQSVQAKISKKMELLTNLQQKADYLAQKFREAEHLGQIITDTNMYDEQLLEGLPGQDFGGKLF